MIYEAISDFKAEDDGFDKNISRVFDLKKLLMLSVATSIDALAAGITFAFLKVNIWKVILFIGVITFICSFLGVVLGNRFSSKFKNKAEIAGGVALILIGIKILLEHIGIINI